MINLLIALVAGLHFYFMILEMFFWTKPLGLRVFGQSLETARASAVLAANQGLYNGFLAAGLIFGLSRAGQESTDMKAFFLACVIAAGAYGGYTVNKKIFFVQGLPALLALSLLPFS